MLVNTSRSLRGPLPAPVVLDHVDALSLNMRRRASGPEASADAGRCPRRGGADAPLGAPGGGLVRGPGGVGGRRCREPPVAAPCEVIPVGWDGAHAPDDPDARDLDVVLSGNMGYPPNRDAAEWFAAEVLPAIRRPAARDERAVWWAATPRRSG